MGHCVATAATALRLSGIAGHRRACPDAPETRIITQALQVSNLYLRHQPTTRLQRVVQTSPHARWVALALNTLSGRLTPAQRAHLLTQTRQRFPDPPDLLAVVLQDLEQPPLLLPNGWPDKPNPARCMCLLSSQPLATL